MGPDGGTGGGTVVATGKPEDVIKKSEGFTAFYLKDEFV